MRYLKHFSLTSSESLTKIKDVIKRPLKFVTFARKTKEFLRHPLYDIETGEINISELSGEEDSSINSEVKNILFENKTRLSI